MLLNLKLAKLILQYTILNQPIYKLFFIQYPSSKGQTLISIFQLYLFISARRFIIYINSYQKQKPAQINMEFQNQVKQALIQLPAAERVVAIALKNIYQKIKKLYDLEKKQIDDSRLTFIERYRRNEQNVASIIKGRRIKQQELAKPDQYFVEQQRKDLKTILDCPTPIKDYWLVAMKNSFLKPSISAQDQKILSSLLNIDSKVFQNTIQICLEFEQSAQVHGGSYKRIVQLDNGMPLKYHGQKINLKKPTSQGFIHELYSDSNQEQQVLRKFEIITFILNSLVPQSLRYYLGQIYDQYEEDEEDDDQDGQGQDQEQQNERANKKKN